MEFTPRIQQILRILLDRDEPVGKQEIADELGVSKRTVQREFEYLELCIRKYHLTLENHKGKGVNIKGSEEDIAALRESVGDESYPDAADREGRRRRLLFELLRDRTPRKLFRASFSTTARCSASAKPPPGAIWTPCIPGSRRAIWSL